MRNMPEESSHSLDPKGAKKQYSCPLLIEHGDINDLTRDEDQLVLLSIVVVA